MAVLWPVVKARLVAALPNVPGFSGVTVYPGPPTESPAKYVTVGYVQEAEFGGAGSMPDSSIDTLREEDGSVVMEFVSWSGDPLATHEAAVFALFDALDTWVRADQRLGVLPAGSTATLAYQYVPVLGGDKGATARLIVTLTYFARH
jgi:hypothetical protein